MDVFRKRCYDLDPLVNSEEEQDPDEVSPEEQQSRCR